ncbi:MULTISPECIES: hypothetical protein [Spirulina sp. CCY15215]|uniref:hypothetical protein n=1 Tax=Spirulina sp. CCY15215 TaxID=2767591 RepID=UPI00194E6D41|nr:hypothetical protein [Spirulina major]
MDVVMRYPKWFPYPSCWVRAIVLDLSSMAVVLASMLAFIVTAMPVGMTGSMLDASKEDASNPLLVAYFLLIGFVLPVVTLSFIDRFVWNRPKAGELFIPRLKSWLDGIFAYVVTLGVAFLVAVIFALFVCDSRYKCRSPETRVWMSVVFTIGLAYVYQGRFLVVQWWQNRQKRKNKRVNQSQLPRAKRQVTPIDDSDREFNEFRWEQQRKRVSPPPSPSGGTVDDELERLRREMDRD